MWTIGVGRNLDHRGITTSEAMYMLDSDIAGAVEDAERIFPNFEEFSDNRKQALVNLIFNVGYNRLLGFRKMIKAIDAGDWHLAASELLDSRYARQVKGRALEISEMLRWG